MLSSVPASSASCLIVLDLDSPSRVSLRLNLFGPSGSSWACHVVQSFRPQISVPTHPNWTCEGVICFWSLPRCGVACCVRRRLSDWCFDALAGGTFWRCPWVSWSARMNRRPYLLRRSSCLHCRRTDLQSRVGVLLMRLVQLLSCPCLAVFRRVLAVVFVLARLPSLVGGANRNRSPTDGGRRAHCGHASILRGCHLRSWLTDQPPRPYYRTAWRLRSLPTQHRRRLTSPWVRRSLGQLLLGCRLG